MLPYYQDNADWQAFFDTDSVRFLATTIVEQWIDSTGTKIHLDVYETGQNAPTVIYCHGLSSCGRMMAYLVRPLFHKGYNIICPDLVGFGMTTRKPGSGTIPEFVQNLLDTVAWAKQRFSGPRFMAGISLGGGLSYYAAAANAEVATIACLNLMDLSDQATHRINSKGRFIRLVLPLLRLGDRFFPAAYLPLKHFLSVDNLSDDPAVVTRFKTNPLVTKAYTFRAGLSLLTTKPAIPLERFDRLPVLVLHGDQDRLIPERVSRRNYDRLPGPKSYVTLAGCGHIPLGATVIACYADALDAWFRQWG